MIRNCAIALSLGVFIAFKGNNLNILFAITTAGVMLCSGPKKSPRTSSIVQIIFYFWSFEINGNILRIQKLLSLESYILDSILFFDLTLEMESHCYRLPLYYANMSVQYTAIFHGCKNDNFQMIFFIFFLFLLKK